uniref:Large ribosomal subunit protein uL3c n=1 Tax=Laurencia australis TaxID=3073067 RepID=A0AA51NEJ6_9FLOR|nr:50S ribosomal protein L3 [Laurencia australis]WMP12088.1 50S ribosomal protein L3 [Laurencia australis]
MSIGMIGKKVGMTQIFNKEGLSIPVTILQIGPCTITQTIQDPETKHTKIQIGYEYIQPNKITKAQMGHFKSKDLPCFKYLKEYKTKNQENINIGKELNVGELKAGNYIKVSGHSIGKGFSGYQKRHHFSRGPMSHGSKNHRQPGSIGAGTTPGRVFPGKRMAGQLGNKRVSIKNLEIVEINQNNNTLVVKGSVPGKEGNLIQIYKH